MNNKYRLIIPVFFIALVDSNGSVSKMHHSLGKLNMLHSYTPSGKGVEWYNHLIASQRQRLHISDTGLIKAYQISDE
ncbi:TPA: hypothetical protein ACM4AF_001586 [Escherichia coli]